MKIWLKLTLALLIACLVVGGVVWGMNRVNRELAFGIDCAGFQFSSADWHSQRGRARFTENGPRTRQANGLLECDSLIGMRRSAVRRMLGPPNRPKFGPPERPFEWRREWSYFVGQGLVDPLVLAVRFSRDGRVTTTTTY